MKSFEHLLPKKLNFEQNREGFEQLLKQQVTEYAKGLDPEITVEISPLKIDSDSFKISGHHLPNGLRFVFRYHDEEKGFTDQEISDGTLPAAEKVLNDFYLEARKFKA